MYRLELAGEVDEDEVNAMSPLQVTIEGKDCGSMLVTSCTDQSGLIGLMRCLHGLGFIVLSLVRVEV
jgi:hypothetical protein